MSGTTWVRRPADGSADPKITKGDDAARLATARDAMLWIHHDLA